MEWTTIASFGARTAFSGYSNRKHLKYAWVWALSKLNLGKTDIVITGEAGAGKSMLAGHMNGEARKLFFKTPGESTEVETSAIIFGETPKLVRILPGQQGRRTKGEIDSIDENKKLEGIIHVVDFGHLIPRDPVQIRQSIDQFESQFESLQQHNLLRETNSIKSLTDTLIKTQHKHKRPKWIIIAVNKIDLFEDSLLDALKFYHPQGGSPFGEALRELQHRVGSNAIEIYVVPCCAHEIDLTWGQVTIQSKLPRQKQKEYLEQFIEVVKRVLETHK